MKRLTSGEKVVARPVHGRNDQCEFFIDVDQITQIVPMVSRRFHGDIQSRYNSPTRVMIIIGPESDDGKGPVTLEEVQAYLEKLK